ncbi:ATP-dependent DNA helicase RecG [Poriferisphaera sp. WC338]|uniref:ATP-dependent DNA helicase RecG n=1 Tax=Poriferisphaera sp. WC338 TaxID=3425129 RepID=UPI003D8148E8
MNEEAAKQVVEKGVRMGTPVVKLPGVGPKRARAFERLGIQTASDLLRHLPMRYEYEAEEGEIASLPIDGTGTARGVVMEAREVPGKGGWGRKGGKGGRFEAILEDESGRVMLTWFNAVYLARKIQAGMMIRAQGKVKRWGEYLQMVNPKWEAIGEGVELGKKEERLKPIYPATEDLASWQIEKVVGGVLDEVVGHVSDPLPAEMLRDHEMPALGDALLMAHRPKDEEEAGTARRRLAFNELLLLQLGITMKKAYVREKLKAPILRLDERIDAEIRKCFPFELTEDQDAVVEEIGKDLSGDSPMNRLLQGDVGSGKTAVAVYALLMAVMSGKQGAIMAPTELLAEQHYFSIQKMLQEAKNVRVELLTGGGGTKAEKDKRKVLVEGIGNGEVNIVVGTHALLSADVEFDDLAVVVIDEQHRFGVMQRAGLKSKHSEGKVPHHLVMTATPIPRTLSLTVFGDLDVSTIKGLPPGRSPIVNRVVGVDKTDDVYRYVNERVERGEQAYVVLPAIEGNDGENGLNLRNVTEHVELLRNKYCSNHEIDVVHGRLKREEREDVMRRFREGEVKVLVATTVIEVGVDVSNATVMVIEHAERFGLAQLHQLRGRVGRGTHGVKSLCVFIGETNTEDGAKRLNAIGSTNDGFKVAEMDLEIRGMGEFFGTRQSGSMPLRVARIPEDMDLLMMAKRDAAKMIGEDMLLKKEEHAALRKVLLNQYGESLGLVDVG